MNALQAELYDMRVQGRRLLGGQDWVDVRTTLPVSDGYEVILPDLSKVTPFVREAIMSAMIEVGAVKR